MQLSIGQSIRLEQIGQQHAKGLYTAIDSNRAHLSEFLPWVSAMKTIEDIQAYIQSCELLTEEKKEVSFVILFEGILVGRIGLHHINLQNKSGAIGYWLSKEAEGKGITIQSCRSLIDYAFHKLKLHRIEIKAAVANLKSQAIPNKLGFQQEGMLREAELLNGRHLDLFLYSMLSQDWTG